MSEQERNAIINNILVQFKDIFTRHGGGAELVAANEDTVILKILGHCTDCALAPLTFGLGIEQQIRQQIPSIKEVRYTNG